MTVRQALALAGGAEFQARMSKPPRDPATLRSDYELAVLQFVQSATKISRLTAERRSQLEDVDVSELPVPKERVAEIQKSQHAILEARMSDFQRERDFLKSTADQADERISVVEKLRTEEEEGSRADTVELRRLLDLLALQIKIPALELALRSPFGASILRGIEEDTQQRIEVVRQSNGDPSKSIVDDDFVLTPGDVIDVSFRAPKDAANASR